MLSAKTLLKVVGVIFAAVGFIHLLRLLTGFQIILGTWDVPLWISIIGVIISWYLSYNAFTLSKKKTKR